MYKTRRMYANAHALTLVVPRRRILPACPMQEAHFGHAAETDLDDQAQRVFERELPNDFVDAHRPDLATIKWAAITIEFFMARSARTGDPLPVLDARRAVRVWFVADQRKVVGFAIEASYDGGLSFENPLTHY